MNLNMSRNINMFEKDKLKRSIQSRGNTYSPNLDIRSTKYDSLSLQKFNNKFSNMNESLLSKFEGDNLNRNNKSSGKINLNNYEEAEGENPLNLHYNYDRRYQSLIDEINFLKDENSGLKGMLERKKKLLEGLEEQLIFSNKDNKDKLTKFKDKIEFFEQENEKFRLEKSKLVSSTNDKLFLLTKLCRKYLRKFKKITILLANVDPIKKKEKSDSLLNDLNNTIEKFWDTLQNPDVFKSLLDINKSLDPKAKEILEEEIEDNKLMKFKPANIEKIEQRFKKIQEENDSLLKKFDKNEGDLKDYDKLKKNYSDLKETYEIIERKCIKYKENNRELKKKYKILELDIYNSKNSLKILEEKVGLAERYREQINEYVKELEFKDMVINKLEKYALNGNQKEEIQKDKNFFSKGKIYETEEEKNYTNLKMKTRNHSDFNIHKESMITNLPNKNLEIDDNRRNINKYQNLKSFSKENLNSPLVEINQSVPENNFSKYNKKSDNYLRKTINENELRNEKLRNNVEFEDFSSKSTLRGELNNIDKEISELQNKLRNYV